MSRASTAATSFRAAAVVCLLLFASSAAHASLAETVRRVDSAYHWQIQGSSGQAVVADLVSQRWRDTAWRHALSIFRPASIRHPDVAILIVGSDARREFVEEQALAEAAGVIVARVGNVPNQPIYGAYEDALIAYTFEQYLKTEDPEWPLLVPMTRAVVRAMDAVGEIATKQWQTTPRRFIVTGASKRGWTSWLAAAVDPRVAGVAPVVFDNLNFAPQMKNQFAIWNAYSPQIGDYTARALPMLTDTERGKKLLAIVDPYAHLEALSKVAKLVINGSNDPYWELNAVNFYWPGLRGPKSLLEIPNAGHAAGGDHRVPTTLAAFTDRVAAGKPMPELRWAGGEPDLSLAFDEAPASVGVWVAQSESRDFRKASWSRLAARREGDRFVVDRPSPAQGYVAAFGEARYAAPTGAFVISTPVRIRGSGEPRERGE